MIGEVGRGGVCELFLTALPRVFASLTLKLLFFHFLRKEGQQIQVLWMIQSNRFFIANALEKEYVARSRGLV